MEQLLLVEHNRLFGDALALLLKWRTGLSSVQAGSLAEAKAILEEENHKPACVVVDLEGAVGRYVQRHGCQGRVAHPLGDYVEQPHLVLLLSEPFRPSGAYLSTTSMMPPSDVWCTGRRSIHPSARTENSAKLIPAGGWPATTQAATARSAGEHAALLPGRILRRPQA